jgi:hypothetical protein
VVHSTEGIVACTQPLAARCGLKVLAMGGNCAVGDFLFSRGQRGERWGCVGWDGDCGKRNKGGRRDGNGEALKGWEGMITD